MPLGNVIFSKNAYVPLHDRTTGAAIFELICPDFRPTYYVITVAGTTLCPGCLPDTAAASLAWDTVHGLQSFDLTFTVNNAYEIDQCCEPWTTVVLTENPPYDGPYLIQYTNPICSGIPFGQIAAWTCTLTRTINTARLLITSFVNDIFGNTLIAFDGTATTVDCGSDVVITNSITSCSGFNVVSGGTATVTAVPC